MQQLPRILCHMASQKLFLYDITLHEKAPKGYSLSITDRRIARSRGAHGRLSLRTSNCWWRRLADNVVRGNSPEEAEQLLDVEENIVGCGGTNKKQLAIRRQDVDACWPSSENLAEGVVHVVNEQQYFRRPPQIFVTLPGACDSLCKCRWLRPLDCPLHGPLVSCMSLHSVHKRVVQFKGSARPTDKTQQLGRLPA